MDTTARVLVTIGASLQVLGVATTARYLMLARQRFARRASSLRLRRSQANEQSGVAASMTALIALFFWAQDRGRKAWGYFATVALFVASRRFRKARRQRREIIVVPPTAKITVTAQAAGTAQRASAPRTDEGSDIAELLNALADFADGLSLRLDAERRTVSEQIDAVRRARDEAVSALDRDVDELATGGIRLGAAGVLLLIIGTALTLAAAWI